MRVDWSGMIPGNLIEIELRGSHLYMEGGRPDWPGRGHEGWGGTFSIEEVRRDRERLLGEFPGLYEEVMDTLTDRHRIVDAPVAVLATVDEAGTPHTTLVRFAVNGDRAYIPVGPPSLDDDRALSLMAHLQATPAVSLMINGGEGDDAWWAQLTGTCAVIDDEAGYYTEDVLTWLAAKHPDVGSNPPELLLQVDISRWEP